MQINIIDYLPPKTFIYVDPEIRKQLFNKLIKTTLTDLSKQLSLKLKNISRYKVGTRAIQKRIFLELINQSGLKLEDFQNKIIIKVGKRGNKLKVGPLIDINNDWVYTSELIRGDGSLVRGNNNSYKTCFTNKNLLLIHSVKDFFLNLGIDKQSICTYLDTKDPKIKQLVIHSETISYLLNSFFEIPFGRKGDMNFPNFIKSNRDFSINAVRGIFDAEGSVICKKWKGKYSRKISITMKDKFYLLGIQEILMKLGINSNLYAGKSIYKLIIGDRRSIIRFYRHIKPLHPEKNKKLSKLVEIYKKTTWVASKDLMPKLLTLLFKNNKRKSEICDILKVSYSQAGLCLTRLQKMGLIKVNHKIFSHRGRWFVYGITCKGRSYLKNKSRDFS